MISLIEEILVGRAGSYHQVVKIDYERDVIVPIDLTSSNTEMRLDVVNDIFLFETFINTTLEKRHAKFAIGGYMELRELYSRSDVFSGVAIEDERRLHLGIDIWGPAGTAVYAPIDGTVHSFAMNDTKGDYGATIILQHELEGLLFHTLYGHLSASDLNVEIGQKVGNGSLLAHFGNHEENGYWPPHLHFQVILDMENNYGDYPGVCSLKNKSHYAKNCPDPNLLLQLSF
jgi:murein DD-endopeptidase MepM/ murein hydrolase activator NlpD